MEERVARSIEDNSMSPVNNMAERDIEGRAWFAGSKSGNTDTSSESSESLDSYSEQISLLPKNGDVVVADYKSTSIGTGESSQAQIIESDPLLDGEEAPVENAFGIIGLLLIGVFIANADGTLVLATYETISSEFHSFGSASWLTTSFSLAVCAVQPLTGKLSDIYGRKGVILFSYVAFAIGSVVCGLGRNFGEVITGRVISGIGSAGMTVLVSIIITDLVPLRNVASWRSYVNVVATVGRSIGGPIGGLLADTIGWRWSFIGQGPLISLAIILVASRLPSHTEPPSITTVQVKGQPSKLRRIDFFGAFLLALSIVSLLGGLSLGGQDYPWTHPFVIVPAVISVVASVIFVVWETKYAFEPIFPPSLIAQRDVATAYGVSALQLAAQSSMMYSVPLYFRATQNSSNTAAGSHLFPAVVGNAIGGLLAGFFIQKTGRYKILTLVATIFSCISYLLMVLRWHGAISLLESLDIVPGGFGNGIVIASAFIGLTSHLKSTEIAMATAGYYLSASIAMVLALAVSSAVQMSTLNVLLENGLSKYPNSKEIIDNVLSDVGTIAKLDKPLRDLVINGYVKSLEYSHTVSLAFSVAAFFLALTIREHRLR